MWNSVTEWVFSNFWKIPFHTGNYLPTNTVTSHNTWFLLPPFTKIYTYLLTRHMTQTWLNIEHVIMVITRVETWDCKLIISVHVFLHAWPQAFTVVLLRIQIFLDVMLCQWVSVHSILKEKIFIFKGRRKMLRNSTQWHSITFLQTWIIIFLLVYCTFSLQFSWSHFITTTNTILKQHTYLKCMNLLTSYAR